MVENDKIEATQERVEECAMLIRELLDEYNCTIHYEPCMFGGGTVMVQDGDDTPPWYEVEL